jgi:hypothetical protein
MALLKSRDLEDEDDDTILERLSFKILVVQRLLKSEVFKQRRHSSLKGRAVDGEHDGERRKAIMVEKGETDVT